MDEKKFLVYGILLIACIIPLIIFNGAVDDFVPRLMFDIWDISQKGYISSEQESSIPGFFVLGSILTLICGFSTEDLLFFPIQLIPFIFVFFLFIYAFSKSYLLSALLTLIEVITGVTGSLKVFFWPHGIGFILFYMLIFIISKLANNKRTTSEFRLLFIIIGSSLVFISYDLFGMFALFMGAVSFIYLILYMYYRDSNNLKSEYYSHFSNYFNLLLTVSVVEFGFSRFLYNKIIPTFMNNNYVEISPIDNFISSFLFKNNSGLPLNDLLVNYPISVSILSAIKYSLLITSILVFVSIIFKKIVAKDTLEFSSIGVLSILVTNAFYGFLRFYIGQGFITYIYLPGLLSASWLYKYSPTFRRRTTLLVLLLLIICPLNYYEISTNDLINKDSSKFGTVKEPSNWCYDHEGSKIIASDVLTQGAFNYYYTKRETDRETNAKKVSFLGSQLNLFTTKDVLFILNQSDYSGTCDNFAINYDSNIINLNNWIVIKSWRNSKSIIENNPKLNKIYNASNIAIFQSNADTIWVKRHQ
ncbi:hypothetical protein [Methanosarcina mazei]|uniref:Glycosyltransferase RgtA/B/C/D-like domain-containing protein n=1 Tax=Methanosarcina mazei LYC TaxID=1434114 RepID=A0A0E3RPQ6_METMZ|nr:hypothetical protein [Methanosarcina mazei]AKB66675.1 hypothetical protein MSMAL_0132 [Methanosarcina mazei LYC]